jgi:ribosomal protein L6P/L9E
MEIDNHLLSLSMEFEKQNIIITEWETEKAKRRHDRKRNKRNKKVGSARDVITNMFVGYMYVVHVYVVHVYM